MTRRKLVIMEVDNGYIVEHAKEAIPYGNVAYICNNFKELRDYVENYFEGGLDNDR